MKNLNLGEKKLNFIEFNTDKEQTLLFIHGNSHSLKTFSKQYESNYFKDYRIVLLDLPGHGESSKMENYSIKNFSKTIVEMIEALELKNIIVIGHSFGGHVAINLLKYYRPEGIIVFGTPPLKNPFDPSAFKVNANAAALVQEKATIKEIETFMLEMNYEKEFLKLGVEDYLKTDPAFRTDIFKDIVNGVHENEIALINSFSGEVMFLLATTDSLINNDYIRNEIISNPKRVLIELESGHSPHIETSDAFNELVFDFAGKVFNKYSDTKIIHNGLQHVSRNEQRN